jgi:phage tail protein X
MADVTYITRDGDVLDLVCRRHYGHTVGTVEKVLAANQGLAAHGPVMPKGVEILLPDVGVPETKTAAKETLMLWD